MRTELSPEEMRAPLRFITITAPANARDGLIATLPTFAAKNRFKIRLSRDPAKPGDVFVQMYRSDIKMIGRSPAGEPRLDLTVYRTLHRIPVEAIDQGVGGLRAAVSELLGSRFEQTVFVRGDDMALEPRTGYAAASTAIIRLPGGAREAVKRQLVSFAEENGLAMGFSQVTPDPKQITFDMYGEVVRLSGSMPFSNSELYISISRTGDRSASLAEIDHLFTELQRAVVQVDGVTFSERPSSR